MLGGWSPGPLRHLERRLDDWEFVFPTIPMPPVGTAWCRNAWAISLFALPPVTLLIGSAHLSFNDGALGSILWWSSSLIVAAFLARALVAGLVRWCVAEGVRVARSALRELDDDDASPSPLLLGFSWGGAVACRFLAEEQQILVEDDDHRRSRYLCPPVAVLLAPTVFAVNAASWSGRGWTPPRPRPFARGRLIVFHAIGDGFCPEEQCAVFSAIGAEVIRCADDHTLCRPETVDAIARAVTTAAAVNDSPP